jgi:hypothetical protein
MRPNWDTTRKAAELWASGLLLMPEALAAQFNLTFNGVQFLPGYPDQWVFTDNVTKDSFHTPGGISREALQKEAQRVRSKYARQQRAMSCQPRNAAWRMAWRSSGDVKAS